MPTLRSPTTSPTPLSSYVADNTLSNQLQTENVISLENNATYTGITQPSQQSNQAALSSSAGEFVPITLYNNNSNRNHNYRNCDNTNNEQLTKVAENTHVHTRVYAPLLSPLIMSIEGNSKNVYNAEYTENKNNSNKCDQINDFHHTDAELKHGWQEVRRHQNRKRNRSRGAISSTPSSPTDAGPKKVFIATRNRFNALASEENENDEKDENTSTTTTTKPPPVMVYGVTNYNKMLADFKTILPLDKIRCKSFSNKRVEVKTNEIDDYRKLVKHLQSSNLEYHTYQIKSERAFRVVIRNLHHSLQVQDIALALAEKGHQVRNIVNIKHRVTKQPLPLFFIDIEPNSNNQDIYRLQYLLNMRITVEAPHIKHEIVQCARCQLYGHTKKYCNRQATCVKCADTHFTHECTKDLSTPAKCANCGNDHPANYRGCALYKQLQELRTNPTRSLNRPSGTQQLTQQTDSRIQQSRIQSNLQFVPAVQQQQDNIQMTSTYAQILSNNQKNDTVVSANNGIEQILNSFLVEIKSLFKEMIQQQNLMFNNVISTIMSAFVNKK